MAVIEDEDTKLNTDKAYFDQRFKDIDDAETVPGFDDSTDKSSGNSGADRARDAEENPNSEWANNVTGQNSGPVGTSQITGRLDGLKKKGPIGLIIGLLVGGGFGLTSLLAPATLLINLKENFVSRFDTQNTSMTIRTNKVIANKLAGDTTTGLCTTKLTIACKFSRPSNSFLSKLADNGIVAKDASGKIIEKKLLGFPNTVPTTYEFTDKSGTLIKSDAKEFASKLASNDEFRSAFHKAFNPRWVGYADSVATKVLAKFGASKSLVIDKTADTKKATESLNKESAGKANAATEGAAAGDAATGVKTVVSGAIEEEVRASASKVTKAGADPALTIATIGCLGINAPGFIAKIVRDYQMVQIIKYGVAFMAVADAMKAGEATPEQVASMSTILTSVFKDSSGNVTNGSAMDSFGIKYALYGDTKTTGFKKDYRDLIPGGKVSSSIPGVALSSDPTIQKTCSAINSPEAQIAAASIEAAVGAGTAGVGAAVIATIKVSGKIVLTMGAIDQIVKGLTDSGFIKRVVDLVPTDMIMTMLAGDFTKNLQGESAGNGLSSSILNYMGQTANASANAPLSKSQAIAYSGLTSSVNLAYAKEDRATLSPLDTSSPNTFLGSIVKQMLPYSSELSSGSGTLSFFGNLLGRSFSYLGNKAGAVTAEDYSMCTDPSISSTDIAAGPFCNIIYGIPVEFINESTADVLSAVSSDIDEVTGEPKDNSDLSNWLSECTTGKAYGAAGCQITKKKTAEYALYFIDHRIQKNMDGEEDYSGKSASIADSSTTNSITDIKWPLDKHFFDQNKADWLGSHTLASGTFTSPYTKGVGDDISTAPKGTPIYSMFAGTVEKVNLCGQGDGMIIASNVAGGTLKVAYGHGIDPKFSVGQPVSAGQQILSLDGVGCKTTGPHLHIDMSFNDGHICPQDIFIAMSAGQTPDLQALTAKANPGCTGR